MSVLRTAAALSTLLLFTTSGCEKEKPKPEVKVEPEVVELEFTVEEETHFDVYVDFIHSSHKSDPVTGLGGSDGVTLSDWFELTVRPEQDEVVFLWSDPEIESMFVGTREEKIAYLLARAKSSTPPSFAVSKDGSFSRMLGEEMLRTIYRADAVTPDDEDEFNPSVTDRFSSPEEMLDARRKEAERFWNQMGGAYRNTYTVGRPKDGPLGSQSVKEREECAVGQCWSVSASDWPDDRDPGEMEYSVTKMKGKVTQKSTEHRGLFDTSTMLPVEFRMKESIDVEAPHESGKTMEAWLSYTEKFRFERTTEPPERARLTELPSFDESPDPDTDAGAQE